MSFGLSGENAQVPECTSPQQTDMESQRCHQLTKVHMEEWSLVGLLLCVCDFFSRWTNLWQHIFLPDFFSTLHCISKLVTSTCIMHYNDASNCFEIRSSLFIIYVKQNKLSILHNSIVCLIAIALIMDCFSWNKHSLNIRPHSWIFFSISAGL